MTDFIAGGPLNPVDDRNVIVPRQELNKILDHLKSSDSYVVLESSRQTGKTTLLYQIQHSIVSTDNNYGVAYLDFSLIINQDEAEFYHQLCELIKLNLIDLIEAPSNATLEPRNVINFQTFSDFLKSLSSQTPQAQKLILIFEEIGHIPEDVFPTFFAGLRGFFNQGRGLSNERNLYKKIIIICAGTLDTKKLIEGENSPFRNICERFTLNDFSREQVLSLAQNLKYFTNFSDEKVTFIVDYIFEWSAGHPYLTQRLYKLIDESEECRNASTSQIFQIINRLVQNELIDNNDVNLEHIFHCLNNLEQETGTCFSAVKQVLNGRQGQPIRTIEHQVDLMLIGIIKRLANRGLVIRNRIYEQKLKLFFGIEDTNTSNKTINQQVYISYNWQEDSNEMANQLVQAFEARGIEIIRDRTHTTYKDSIKNFMQQIGQGKCVVVVISDRYLKSENCMFELVEIAKNGNFYNRIFPLVLPDAKIYKDFDRLDYLKYWEQEKAKLQEKYKVIDLARTNSILETLNLYDEIRRDIDNLTNILKDMNTLLPDLHRESEFEAMIQAVEDKLAEDSQN